MRVFNFKGKNTYVLISALIVIAAAIGFVVFRNKEEPDLSPLNIENALSSMVMNGEVMVEIDDDGTFIVSTDEIFLEAMEKDYWEEAELDYNEERTSELKVIIQEKYWINFYADGVYAGIFHEDTQERYRYYTIPQGLHEHLKSYILENGVRSEVETTDTRVGYITGIDRPDFTQITFDPVEWITYEDTVRMEEIGLDEEDMPGGYYIYNPVMEEVIYEVDAYTEYRYIDWENAFNNGGEDGIHISTLKEMEFFEHVNAYEDRAAHIPFWVTVKNGIVQVIEEQYVP